MLQTVISDSSNDTITTTSDSGNNCYISQGEHQHRTVCRGNVLIAVSGINFLISKCHPLLYNSSLRDTSSTSCLVFPTLNATSFAKLLYWLSNQPKVTLEINKNDCVPVMQIALVFNLQKVVEKCQEFMTTAIIANQGQLCNAGLITTDDLRTLLFEIRNCSFLKDDVYFSVVGILLSNLKEAERDQGSSYLTSESPRMSPLVNPTAYRKSLRLFCDDKANLETASKNGVDASGKPTSKPLKSWFIFKKMTPKLMSLKKFGIRHQQEVKSAKKQEVSTSDKTLSSNANLERVSKQNENAKGELLTQPVTTKRDPLALSVIRKIPRTKPTTKLKT